jgi:ParB family chromosome partitioning protein
MLRLLELNEHVKAMLAGRQLEMGHARALLSLPSDAQPAAAQLIFNKGYSVREAESMVRRLTSPPAKKRSPISVQDPNVRSLQESIGQKLGAHVEIHHSQTGKGKVLIHFSSLDELDGILRHIQ